MPYSLVSFLSFVVYCVGNPEKHSQNTYFLIVGTLFLPRNLLPRKYLIRQLISHVVRFAQCEGEHRKSGGASALPPRSTKQSSPSIHVPTRSKPKSSPSSRLSQDPHSHARNFHSSPHTLAHRQFLRSPTNCSGPRGPLTDGMERPRSAGCGSMIENAGPVSSALTLVILQLRPKRGYYVDR